MKAGIAKDLDDLADYPNDDTATNAMRDRVRWYIINLELIVARFQRQCRHHTRTVSLVMRLNKDGSMAPSPSKCSDCGKRL